MAASASPSSLLLRAFSPHPTPHARITTRPRLLSAGPRPSPLVLRPPPRRNSAVALARRKKNSSGTARKKSTKNELTAVQIDEGEGNDIDEDAFEALFSQLEEDLKKDHLSDDDGENNDIDEDAFEALFIQLEEDLKNDNLSDADVDDEITEDLARLEQELEDALCDDDRDEIPGAPSLNSEDEAEEEAATPKLKNWQLRRLARALRVGRRKTSIKNLAAELGLERPLVLEVLRNPPPNLLLLSASLPDLVTQEPPEPENKSMESPISTSDVAESKPEVGVPVHVMQTRWSMQKRLKKVQIETLERVYARTKRPTNTMISSLVHVTNLPRKRVVQWFEEKRVEDGVPKERVPFQRSTAEAITSQ